MARVYVDLDDVLSRTIRGLLGLLERTHGRVLPEEEVAHFDLGRSFGLGAEELDAFMELAHREEVLAALEPDPGAPAALSAWLARGHAVFVMTGRPPSTREVSRRWLEAHAIPHSEVACVDKYGRRDWGGGDGRGLPLGALPRLDFALAVEDSLEMAAHLVERCRVPVALMDRPWNRDLAGLRPATVAAIVRCHGWGEVLERFPNP